MPESRTQRLLQYAVQQLGRSDVAKRLKVAESQLATWIDGTATVPHRAQLALADLVQELDKKQK